jgi:hypothetical protein
MKERRQERKNYGKKGTNEERAAGRMERTEEGTNDRTNEGRKK